MHESESVNSITVRCTPDGAYSFVLYFLVLDVYNHRFSRKGVCSAD
jgi:hypothetical protein